MRRLFESRPLKLNHCGSVGRQFYGAFAVSNGDGGLRPGSEGAVCADGATTKSDAIFAVNRLPLQKRHLSLRLRRFDASKLQPHRGRRLVEDEVYWQRIDEVEG